MTLQFSELLIW